MSQRAGSQGAEDAGYVKIVTEFINRKSHTAFQLTKIGREAFKEYRKKLKQVFFDLAN